MKYSPKDLFVSQHTLSDKINSIPKKNKQKFAVDLLKLIEYAQKDDYENYNLE